VISGKKVTGITELQQLRRTGHSGRPFPLNMLFAYWSMIETPPVPGLHAG